MASTGAGASAKESRIGGSTPADFTTAQEVYAGETCHGVRITLADRAALDAPRLGLELAAALRLLCPQRFELAGMLGNLGSRASLAALAAGESIAGIVASWRPALQIFEAVRRKHLLYQ